MESCRHLTLSNVPYSPEPSYTDDSVPPVAVPAEHLGNTVACRLYHASLAASDPAECQNASLEGGGFCGVSPCEGFCDLFETHCRGMYNYFQSRQVCLATCQQWTVNQVPFGVTSGASFECHLTHAQAAAATPWPSCLEASSSSCSCSAAEIPAGECDGNPAQQCESSLFSFEHCGQCGRTCAPNEKCDLGKCVAACSYPQALCGDRCVDINSDSANCGQCGRVCPVGQMCDGMGQCFEQCNSGLLTCDGRCIWPQSNLDHCGECGHRCGPGQTCQVGSCTCLGWRLNCNQKDQDGCEVLAYSDTQNCGGCGKTCDPGKVCQAGICTAPVLLASGQEHTCRLFQGQVACFGSNVFAQLGVAENELILPGVGVPVDSAAMQLSASLYQTCALVGPEPNHVVCWGRPNATYYYSTPSEWQARVIEGSEGALSVFVGPSSACLVREEAAWCWGDGVASRLPSSGTPTMFGPQTGVQSVALGSSSGCLVSTEGAVRCWGEGSVWDSWLWESGLPWGAPLLLKGVTDVRQVFLDDYSVCLQSRGLEVTCRGVGNQSRASLYSLAWRGASYGMGVMCGIQPDGKVVCFGAPSPVPEFTGAVAVSAEKDRICAAKADGSVWCWSVTYPVYPAFEPDYSAVPAEVMLP